MSESKLSDGDSGKGRDGDIWCGPGVGRSPSKLPPSKSGRPRPSNLQKALVQDNVPVKIDDKIFVGSLHCAFNQEALKENHITHILNVSGMAATFPKDFTYLSIEIRDKDYTNLLACIPAANIFIEAALESGGAILVHCAGGKSRSPSLIMAYLMQKKGFTYDEALYRLHKQRSVVALNKGFEAQLRAFGEVKCDVYAAHQLLLRQRIALFSAERSAPSDKKSDSKHVPIAPTSVSSPARLRLTRPGSASGILIICVLYSYNKCFVFLSYVFCILIICVLYNMYCIRIVQVIPPLRGMELGFICKSCSQLLFVTSSIVKHNVGADNDGIQPSMDSGDNKGKTEVEEEEEVISFPLIISFISY